MATAQQARPIAVLDMRWESGQSRTLRPHFELAHRLMSEGFSGDVIVLVDDDYKTTGWASETDLSTFPANNDQGGTLIWSRASELASSPTSVDLYIRMEALPQDLAALPEAAGLYFNKRALVLKLSILGPSDKAAVEALSGQPANEKSYDGWIVYDGHKFEIQSLATRASIAETMTSKKLTDYAELFVSDEAKKIVPEIIQTYNAFQTGVGGNKDPHGRFMEFSSGFTMLRSRLRLAWHPKKCETSVAKPKSATGAPATNGAPKPGFGKWLKKALGGT